MNPISFFSKTWTKPAVIAVLSMVILATVVFAQTTNVWDPDPVPEPTWDVASQSWVTSGTIVFAQPYQEVCIAYGDDNNNLVTAIECTLDTTVTPHPFTCSIPGTSPEVANRTTPIYWRVYATEPSAGPCFSSQGHFDSGGDGYVAPNGTGPTAITLQSFDAGNPVTPAIWLGIALVTGAILLTGAFALRKRSQS